jgi:hypothetical protein
MEKFIAIIKTNVIQSEKRLNNYFADINKGMESIVDLNDMIELCSEAKKQETLFKFFKTIQIRYEADSAANDLPAFKSFCLDIIAGEFYDRSKCPTLTKVRSELLEELRPYLAK